MRATVWISGCFAALTPVSVFSLDATNPPVRGGPITLETLTITQPGSTGDASLLSVKRGDGATETLRALADGVAAKADKADLGSSIPGVAWRPFQTRILITKDHQPGEAQGLLDVQVNTRPGTINGGSGVGNGVSVTSRVLAGTKYGHFSFVALTENYSEMKPGDPFFGHTGASLYINQNKINSAPGWGYAAEVKETHGLSNPMHGSLAGENAIIATGTDVHRKRAGLFIPLNILPGNEKTPTEAAQGWYVKTAPNARFYDGGLFEGDYGNVINASSVNARSFIVGTGKFSSPVIDLHAVQAAGNGAAIALNATHSLQWQTAEGVSLGGIGYDTSVPAAQTIQITGVRVQEAPGGEMEAVININGKRYGIRLRPLP
ncbi:hypothetical protein [Methylobacterium goesingense]|uniref:Uncharacterized protein n=1 Tax=Methylobacterium goesingense TaxID=243690 RepID=A0ABV2L3F4_9HYPH|nr:hypothetical protein [Methylobacterium goesingense]GJD73107.1 hypothetical protein CFIICLFH_1332 [Methylobacterium goesingense]